MADRYLKPRARDRFMTMPVSGGYDVTPIYPPISYESEIVSAIEFKLQTAVDTINTSDFTALGSPSFEVSDSTFPNGREEAFIDLAGDRYSFSDTSSLDSGNFILSCWVKPDFSSSYSTEYRNLLGAVGNAGNTGIRFYWDKSDLAFKFLIFTSSGAYTHAVSGLSFSADEVFHICALVKEDNGLDSGVSTEVYINGTKYGTGMSNSSWTASSWNSTSYIGDYANAPGTYTSRYWDGGVFDFAVLNYTTLSADVSDADIVSNLYDNEYGSAGTHKFICEMS